MLVEPHLGQQPPFTWSDYVRTVVVPALEEDRARFRQVYVAAGGLVRVYEVARCRRAFTAPGRRDRGVERVGRALCPTGSGWAARRSGIVPDGSRLGRG